MLRTKCRRLAIEVIRSPRANGGRPSGGRQDRCLVVEVIVRLGADRGLPSDGRQNLCLLTKVKYAELVGDEI